MLLQLLLLAVALTPLLIELAVDKVQLWFRMVVMVWLLALIWQLHQLLLKIGSLLHEQEHQPWELFVELSLVA